MALSVMEVSALKPNQNRVINWNKIQLSTYRKTIQKYLLILKFEVDKIYNLSPVECFLLNELQGFP